MQIFGKRAPTLSFVAQEDSLGVNFLLPTAQAMKDCLLCSPEIDGNTLKQFATLSMLEEEGFATQLKNGFSIDKCAAASLDDNTRAVLGLPQPWQGSFDTVIQGLTDKASFHVALRLLRPNGVAVSFYDADSAYIKISNEEYYLPSPAQRAALDAVQKHTSSKHDEYTNLLVIYQLQQAKASGCAIHLHHFANTKLVKPEEISVIGEVQEDGALALNPYFGENLDFYDVEQRLGQLDTSGKVKSLRIRDTFILLDDKKLEAMQEIIQHRHIPAKNVQQFMQTPTRFLDGELVDLDLGFSARMHGAVAFKHAYFGDTEGTGISWFEQMAKDEEPLPPSHLKHLIEDEEELAQVSEHVRNAMKKGATVCTVKDNLIDVSDEERVEKALVETHAQVKKNLETASADEPQKEKVVVDVDLNDVEVSFGGENFESKLQDILYQGELDFSGLARQPFPHQEVGIRWILGLAQEGMKQKPKDAICGGMLADDMGLGKTMVGLVAASEILRLSKEQKLVERPILVVAPKSLLSVWANEVSKTFEASPFSDIVALHGSSLNKFKQKGMGQETEQVEGKIDFSLKVGSSFQLDRLDMPRRLVLTTYETLRNFQFSLCSIDWGMVIFDEAQHIKNPNTVVTRAAKGLKSCFKLVATGTPVENSLSEFWCLMDTARPNALGSYQHFKKTFINPIVKAPAEDKYQMQESVGTQLRQTVGVLMLRRMKESELKGLPKKYIYSGIDGETLYKSYLQKTMLGKQLGKYNASLTLVAELQRSGKKGVVLSGLQQLRLVSLHPRLYKDSDAFHIPEQRKDALEILKESGKLEICLNILDAIKQKDDKVIIFLVNKELQSQLKIALTKIYALPIHIINGDTKVVARDTTSTREGLIDDFERREGFAIIIMSPIAAGTGLTITEANHVIHLERHWNPAKEAQATDRAYRIGQKKDVHVYLPILKHPDMDSFDVNLHKLLSSKVELKDAVVTPEEVDPNRLFGATLGKQVEEESVIRGEDLRQLDWREFEALCTVLFAKELKGEGILTPKSGDHGADVMIYGQSSALIECKHSKDAKKYGEVDPITRFDYARKHYQEIYDKKINRLILASNVQSFGWNVKRAAKKVGVELYACKDIDALLQKHEVKQMDIEVQLSKG